MVWRISSQIVGVVLVLFTLRDVFRDLFHPTLSGSLSGWIAKGACPICRLFVQVLGVPCSMNALAIMHRITSTWPRAPTLLKYGIKLHPWEGLFPREPMAK